MLASRKQRRAQRLYNILSNSVWQVNASLRTREFESQSESMACARGFELMQKLTEIVEECNQHRDVARAWLLAGRVGYATVEYRHDLGLAAISRFYRNLRRYDLALAD